MDNLIILIQENLVQGIAILIGFLGMAKSALKQTERALSTVRTKAEKVDLDALTEEFKGVKEYVKEMTELQETIAEFQIVYNKYMPEEYKDKLKGTLEKYKKEE